MRHLLKRTLTKSLCNRLLHNCRGLTRSGFIPGVNDIQAAVPEICYIATREFGSSRLGDGCDLRIRVADRTAKSTALSGNPRKHSRGVALETEDAPRQVLGKHCLRCCKQFLAALAFGEQLNPKKISASVIEVVKSSVPDCFATQATTRGEGLGLMSSESTLVSRMIILENLAHGA